MNWHSKTCLLVFAGSLALVLCVPAIAQQSPSLITQDQTGSVPPPQKTPNTSDDNWHVSISPYLWFAGVHGTVGALGRTVGFDARVLLQKFGCVVANAKMESASRSIPGEA